MYTHIFIYFFNTLFLWHLTRSLLLLQAAVSMLKQDYKEGEMTLSSALALAVKVLNKTMDVSKLSAEKGEAQKDFLMLFPFTISGPKLGPALLPTVYDNKTLFRTDCFSGDCHPDTGRWEDENKSAETERSGGTHQAPRGRRGEG